MSVCVWMGDRVEAEAACPLASSSSLTGEDSLALVTMAAAAPPALRAG